jgi:hypothetical protein
MHEDGPPMAALALAHSAIQKSKLVVYNGTRHLRRLKVEIEDLHNQIRGSHKAIAETRAFLERTSRFG